ncbi:ornithine cyclodeaminase family protein [Culicoidibacter larvae]|uniref:Ornithine cyclodeaminase family protein n=1 Tax=Culicoidibacter larvae TaxID=2579976 RepID=A0A5R8QAK2_9FIRM|nr:ornithine cyclodeaminase family protein [Culicoidibacter larvae]TLG72887.1 ornithine cyclodeaminase family protein [Culicoidibacter larvae]
MEFTFLNEETLAATLKMTAVVETIEKVYVAKSQNHSVVWDTIFYDFVPGKADMDIKSGLLESEQIFGHKTVTWFGDNAKLGLPTLTGLICVFDATTGFPVGITTAAYITGMRTGAAAAIGAKYLAEPSVASALIIGAGNQLRFQVAALLTAFPDLTNVAIYDKDRDKVIEAIADLPRQCEIMGVSCATRTFEVVTNLEAAVKANKLIITITPSKEPIIKAEWVSPGTHFSCMGADMSGKQEIDAEIFADALIYTDDLHHAAEVGEMETALKQDIIKLDDVAGEIGELITGAKKPRVKAKVTIFDATGMAIMDLATAKLAIETAKDSDVVTLQI